MVFCLTKKKLTRKQNVLDKVTEIQAQDPRKLFVSAGFASYYAPQPVEFGYCWNIRVNLGLVHIILPSLLSMNFTCLHCTKDK